MRYLGRLYSNAESERSFINYIIRVSKSLNDHAFKDFGDKHDRAHGWYPLMFGTSLGGLAIFSRSSLLGQIAWGTRTKYYVKPSKNFL